jgi:hypothetical protein
LFSAGEGTVVVTLTQVTGSTSVVVQVCPQNKMGDSLCSIQPWARLAGGESVRAPLQGGRGQEINVYSGNCFTTGAVATTATYTVTVEHPR